MEISNEHIKPEVVEMRVPAKMEYIGLIRLSIAAIGDRMGFSIDHIEDLKIAISEACINAIKHGYNGENSDNSIELRMLVYPDKLKIVIKDEGKGFDTSIFKLARLPAAKAGEGKNGGIGFLVIDELMDEVKYFSTIGKGTKVEMTKYKK